MSTQAAQSIGFTHTFPQQAFRLLELPPELLELLSSDNPPTLFLKSLPSDAYQSTADAGTREYVNLCTPTKTFRLRQVHSSNSVHLIRPSNENVPLNGETDEHPKLDFAERITAIAKCGSTLELHTLEKGSSSTEFLERSLRVYDRLSSDGDVQMTGSSSNSTLSESKRVKEQIFDDIPMSIAECESAWKELCAFVYSDTTTGDLSSLIGFRPSARVKLDVWKRMLEGSVLQSIDIEKQFLVRDLWKAVLDGEEEPFPRPLFEAIIRRLAESSGSNDIQAYDSEVKWSNLDKVISVKWIGETYLEVSTPTASSAIGRNEFLNSWKDLLPESWRDQATFNLLTEDTYKYPDPNSICFVNESERQKMKKESSGAATGATAKNPRNWHERFKNQRR